MDVEKKSKVINFPGAQNLEVIRQKKEIGKIILSIESKMSKSSWDVTELNIMELQALANFGEVMKFKPLISSRIAAVLATTLIKKKYEDLYK